MRVIVVHGIAGDEIIEKNSETRTYDKHWMPWIESEFGKKDIEVIRPIMPDAWDPDYNFWKEGFEQIEINEDDVLVGHSGGCSFLVRWLGETGKKVRKLILVAPWKIQSMDFSEGENELYDFKINRRVGKNVDEIVVFTSDDEEPDGKESAKIYVDFLGAELIELNGHGHYCFGDMGTVEFPELLKKIIE